MRKLHIGVCFSSALCSCFCECQCTPTSVQHTEHSTVEKQQSREASSCPCSPCHRSICTCFSVCVDYLMLCFDFSELLLVAFRVIKQQKKKKRELEHSHSHTRHQVSFTKLRDRQREYLSGFAHLAQIQLILHSLVKHCQGRQPSFLRLKSVWMLEGR